MCAVDLPDRACRDAVVRRMYESEKVILLPCGERGIRFRPALTVTGNEIDTWGALARSLRAG